jgi:hypothetical protein
MKNFKFCNMGPWHLIDTYIFRQHGGTYSVTVVPLLCEDTVEPSVWLDPHVKTAAYKLFQNLLISFGRADLILGAKMDRFNSLVLRDRKGCNQNINLNVMNVGLVLYNLRLCRTAVLF